MLLWSALVFCALGAVTSGAPATGIRKVRASPPDAVKDLDAISFSNGRGQVFETTDELIQSFRRQKPVAPELPAVIPSRRFPKQIANKEPQASAPEPISIPNPNKESTAPESSIPVPKKESTTSEPSIPIPNKELQTPEYSTPNSTPPRPDFNRSLHLKDDLTVPGSDYTETFYISWHAESNTARTEEDNGIVYRMPLPDGKIQFLKVEEARILTVHGFCTRSPPLPASDEDKRFPGLPDIKPFQFVGYTTEEGRHVEHWQHTIIGLDGEGGAVKGESLNYTHDLFVYRDGWHAVPLRYSVVTDSSILGPESDSYTHRYTLLPAPTAPILPDIDVECDGGLKEYQAEKSQKNQENDSGNFPWIPGRPPSDKIMYTPNEQMEILTPTLL